MKLILTGILLFFYFTANACECSIYSMKQSFESHDLIVKAKVIGLNDTVQYDLFSNTAYPPFKKGSSPKLKISKVYKGKLTANRIELTSHHSLCDYFFEPNKEYIIFISKINGKLETSVCAYNFETTDNNSLKEFQKIYKKR